MSPTLAAHRLFAIRWHSHVLFDFGIAAVALAGSLGLLAHGGVGAPRPGSVELDLPGAVLAACSTLPLVAWRRFPHGVFVLTAAAGLLLTGLGYPIGLPLGPTAALYLLATSRERNEPWTRRTIAAGAGLLVVYPAAAAAALGTFPSIEFHTSLAWALAWLAGERTRLRREQIVELRERALRAEHEVERERLLATAEERARIARDLHDSAGHAISVIAVRAGAARLRHSQNPDRSLIALTAIEELARQTVEDIDRIVGTLRERGTASGVAEAPPGLASLGNLIAQHTAAGLAVTFDTAGSPRALPRFADQAAYRILQEALTNVARHGQGSACVGLVFEAAAVELTVVNPEAGGSPRLGGGHGLIGMRERAILLGGELSAERCNGEFRVRARIPC